MVGADRSLDGTIRVAKTVKLSKEVSEVVLMISNFESTSALYTYACGFTSLGKQLTIDSLELDLEVLTQSRWLQEVNEADSRLT